MASPAMLSLLESVSLRLKGREGEIRICPRNRPLASYRHLWRSVIMDKDDEWVR